MSKAATSAAVSPAPTTSSVEEKSKAIQWKSLDEVLSIVESDKENIIIVGLGVTWCYPSRKTLKYLSTLSESNEYGNVKILLLDQEKNRDYCRKNDIIVGTPVTMVYFNGHPMMFSRGEWEPSNKLKGALNVPNIHELISSTVSAINMGTQEIHVAFWYFVVAVAFAVLVAVAAVVVWLHAYQFSCTD